MKYEKMCKEILGVIDRSNIQDVFCCVTRLRLVVKDISKIDKAAIEKIDGVMQVKEVGDQLQLVIGSHVQEVYRDFCSIADFKPNAEVEEEGVKPSEKTKKNIGAKVLNILSAIFLPIMPAFVAGGMIKSLVLILTVFGILAGDNGVVTVLNAIGDAPFYYLPFLAGYTTAKRFKLNEVFGLMVAGCLMYPTFLNQTAGESIPFLFFNVPAYNYASSVLPVILSVIAFSYLFGFVNKLIPSNLRIVFSGLISFAVFMPVLLIVVAPLGNYCGQILSTVAVTLFHLAGPLAGAIFAGLMPFIIMTGMHSALAPIMLQNLNTLGYDFLFPAFFINNISIAGATLGAALKIKDPKMKAAAVSSGGLGVIGITEPALYSIDILYKQPLIGAIIGGATGGLLYMILGVKCYAYAMPGIFSLPAYLDKGNNIIMICICLVAAFVVSFVYSFIMTKDNK